VVSGHSRGNDFPWNTLEIKKVCNPWIFISNELSCTSNKDCMQKLQP
jgi:hypothetical protein